MHYIDIRDIVVEKIVERYGPGCIAAVGEQLMPQCIKVECGIDIMITLLLMLLVQFTWFMYRFANAEIRIQV